MTGRVVMTYSNGGLICLFSSIFLLISWLRPTTAQGQILPGSPSEDINNNRVATEDQINKLPIHIMTQEEIDKDTQTDSIPPCCSICLAPYEVKEELRTLPCDHKFHKHCIDEWLVTKNILCPLCRKFGEHCG